jgi:hypothetical protein
MKKKLKKPKFDIQMDIRDQAYIRVKDKVFAVIVNDYGNVICMLTNWEQYKKDTEYKG